MSSVIPGNGIANATAAAIATPGKAVSVGRPTPATALPQALPPTLPPSKGPKYGQAIASLEQQQALQSEQQAQMSNQLADITGTLTGLTRAVETLARIGAVQATAAVNNASGINDADDSSMAPDVLPMQQPQPVAVPASTAPAAPQSPAMPPLVQSPPRQLSGTGSMANGAPIAGGVASSSRAAKETVAVQAEKAAAFVKGRPVPLSGGLWRDDMTRKHTVRVRQRDGSYREEEKTLRCSKATRDYCTAACLQRAPAITLAVHVNGQPTGQVIVLPFKPENGSGNPAYAGDVPKLRIDDGNGNAFVFEGTRPNFWLVEYWGQQLDASWSDGNGAIAA